MQRTPWHSFSWQDSCTRLETDPEKGLTPHEVEQRLAKKGKNLLSPPPRTPAWRRFIGQFENPLVIILLVAAAASFFAGRATDAAVILAVTIVNAIIGFVQEQKAQSAIDALAKMVKTECNVLRHGEKPLRIDSEGLVPGDVVLLATGDRVPADLRLIEGKNLQINESALTGESVPAEKHVKPVDVEAGVGDRRCLGFSSSLVTSGSGRGVVVETGDDTEIGLINKLMNETDELDTPLMQRLEEFSKVFGIWVVGFGALIFGVGVWRGGWGKENVTEMFMAAVSAAVGAIPEGLPAVMTIVLAIGVKNMAARKAIIRKLPAVETLGSVTVICSDKTGTLTANEMTVQRLHAGRHAFNADGIGFNPAMGKVYGPDDRDPKEYPDFIKLLKAGVLCNDAHLVCNPHGVTVEGDPTEGALLTASFKAGFDADQMRKTHPRLDVVPFDSARQIMATLNQDPDGTPILWVKGSTERLLPMCNRMLMDGEFKPLDANAILLQVEEQAKQGMRVLAFAMMPMDKGTKLIVEPLPELIFLGLQAMIDPPRPEVRQALEICQHAGIEVKMITGDHLATATAIARDLGIGKNAGVGVSGKELAASTPEQLAVLAEKSSVFARVAPEHKFKLVEALQQKRHLVAMTGDGVNDAPALKKADIGVSMGVSGTEVAKEASDMILVDDNFATLVRAVEEGRNVFNNLVKSMVYILPTNTGQGLVILAAVLLGLKLPITPVQVLWVNLLTAFLSLPLAFEAMERGLMEKKPRSPDEPLIGSPLLWRIITVSCLMTLVSFIIFWYERRVMDHSMAVAQTTVVATMVGVELFYLFPARGLWAPMPGTSWTLNPVLWPCVAATIALQLAFTYVPFLQKVMGSSPIGLETWAVIFAASALVIPLIETLKRFQIAAMEKQLAKEAAEATIKS